MESEKAIVFHPHDVYISEKKVNVVISGIKGSNGMEILSGSAWFTVKKPDVHISSIIFQEANTDQEITDIHPGMKIKCRLS